MTKSHGVGYFSDKDRRRVRRSYKTKDRRRKPNNKEDKVEDFQEDS